ncbi:Arginase family [Fragilaria crotonensis]|nr:Arginase family [Fragilaria crotonensis]
MIRNVVITEMRSTSTLRTSQRCFSTGGGAGLGNVRDQMMPSLHQTDLFQHATFPKTVSILGAPMTYGQPFVGTDTGPLLLREGGLRNMLTSLGWRVDDIGDIDFEQIAHRAIKTAIPSARNCGIVGAVNEHLSKVVEEKIFDGRFPLLLGGDHSIGIGSLAGVLRARPNTGVLWVDAHADLNTPAISESGNMHGMPVGLLMEGVAPDFSELPGMSWLIDGPRLSPDSLVYVGLRDVDVAERNIIRKLGITAFTMHDIDHYGIGAVMDMALGQLLKDDPNRPLHLSYDIDAVDPFLAPATGTAVRGGLNFREAHYVAEAMAMSGNLASADLVELNPTLADGKGAEDTVELGLQIITSMMGKSIL